MARKLGTWLFCGAIAAAVACGSSGGGSSFTEEDAGGGQDATAGTDAAHPPLDAAPADVFQIPLDADTTFAIAPANPIVDVTIADGAITMNPPVAFKATVGGSAVAATWSIDRGELGTLGAQSGTFTAAGTLGGVAVVSAQFGAQTATTKVTVRLHATQNGGAQNADAGGGSGGIGGVGGEGNGGPVGASLCDRMKTESNAPPAAGDLYWLYPYDKTVWPRGLLAPLLQWATSAQFGSSHGAATDVFVHLKEDDFEFQGCYSVESLTGVATQRQPIDATAWKQAGNSNGGEPLHVEVKYYSKTDDKVWGPIAEDWTIAGGVLKGTVYYNSYNTRVTGNGAANGAALAIKPGAAAPSIAVPGTETTCFVCHSVSADGSTLFAQDNTAANGGYDNGRAYDLKTGSEIAAYTGTAPDGSSNNRKFLWSGVYPDGSFAMASGKYTREAWTSGNSALYKRSDGTVVDASGWSSAVTTATTPVFSDDGRHLAFNFWEGPGANGVMAGNGQSLAIMDFSCGAPAGSIACGSPPYAFSNLRELYRSPTQSRWVGWPAFLPDAKGIVFHNTIKPGINNGCPADGLPHADGSGCVLATWYGAQAELWYVDVPPAGTAPQPVQAGMLNGVANGIAYLPRLPNHPSDEVLNYEPTVNPIASGGYYWVVFTSRRAYGNVASGDPYDNGDGTYPIPKKLWVAAIDINGTPGKDPSHPAFYLPGQELDAGNMRGYWVVDPCKSDGQSCETGDECCAGFCRPGDAGPLVCGPKPPGGCAQEFESCKTDGDCCGVAQGIVCINGRCAKPNPK